MKRGELIEVVVHTIRTHRLDRFSRREMAEAILDEVEPLIRADEREKFNELWKDDFAAEMDALRGKMMALPSWAWGKNNDGHTALWINRTDVLALLGGEE